MRRSLSDGGVEPATPVAGQIGTMRIVYLAAGAGGRYCGACARDVTLARRLMALGHDVLLVPLYTPLSVDGADPSYRHVFYGGIHTYLEHRWSLFRRRLPVIDRLLDSRWLLRAVSGCAIDTRPEDLGEMTVSVLRGPAGRQVKELEELLGFLEKQGRPDVVNLTNSLLSAIAPAVKDRLRVSVVCTLQGEEQFVARLGQPYRTQAWELMRANAAAIDMFVAPSADYAEEMQQALGVEARKLCVIRPGVDTDFYHSGPVPPDAPFRVGCLSRVSPGKGSDLLCAAFREVERTKPGRAELHLAGYVSARDAPWWADVERRFDLPSLRPRYASLGEVHLDDKTAFLRGLSVFVQMSRIVERRGMAALEALACGVPAVLPRSGIFVEMATLTGGCTLVESGDSSGAAATILRLMDDPQQRRHLAVQARAGIQRHYSADRMAAETLAAYEGLAQAV